MVRIALISLGHLNRELTCRCERHDLNIPVLHVESREQWQCKRGSFARSGGRMAQQIQPFQQMWNSLRLNRRRCLVANLVERGQERLRDLHVAKRHCRGLGLGHWISRVRTAGNSSTISPAGSLQPSVGH